MAGSCIPIKIRFFADNGVFPATDFELVAVGIFKEKGVITGAIFGAKFRPFDIAATKIANESGDSINFFTRITPKSDSCTVRSMVAIFGKPEKVRGPVPSDRVERSPGIVRAIVGETEGR